MISINETNLSVLIKDKKVIIYGAHLIATELYRYIDSTVKIWNFLGFAVTCKTDNPESVENKKVRELKEYRADKDVVVFVAMPERYYDEVTKYARTRGFFSLLYIGQSSMESMKSEWILKHCNAKFKDKYDLYEDLYDKSWLNIALKENRVCYKKADSWRRHYKFPTLYYLNMEQVWQEVNNFDYLGEYERTFGTYHNLREIEKKKLNSGENVDVIEILQLYMVFSQWDNGRMKSGELPSWIMPIQAGSILTDLKADWVLDESGENISEKNRMFAEMTAAYWIWKNAEAAKYKGLCHYRRHFLLDQDEVISFIANDIDVILTTPRYTPGGIGQMFQEETPVKKPVYEAMLQAVEICHPEDREALEQYMEKRLYCPNNMVIAKSEIYDSYCEWIFPILFRMEEMDEKTGYGHKGDRHIAYAAEILTSYYFSAHRNVFHIFMTDYYFGG